MRFWDTSAIVPLLVVEQATPAVKMLLVDDPDLVVWWGTRLECASALARAERSGAAVPPARDRLEAPAATWAEVEATEPLRRVAARLLRVHPLRAADALHSGAAIVLVRGSIGPRVRDAR